jgi:phage host-nuclease inhibitor protein Gam
LIRYITQTIDYFVRLPFKENLIMDSKREYVVKMAARLKELDVEISKLEKIADKAVAEIKAEYSQQIKDLFLKKEELQNKVSKVIEASGNAWDDIRAGAGLSWEVLNDSVKPPSQKKRRHLHKTDR